MTMADDSEQVCMKGGRIVHIAVRVPLTHIPAHAASSSMPAPNSHRHSDDHASTTSTGAPLSDHYRSEGALYALCGAHLQVPSLHMRVHALALRVFVPRPLPPCCKPPPNAHTYSLSAFQRDWLQTRYLQALLGVQRILRCCENEPHHRPAEAVLVPQQAHDVIVSCPVPSHPIVPSRVALLSRVVRARLVPPGPWCRDTNAATTDPPLHSPHPPTQQHTPTHSNTLQRIRAILPGSI